MLGLLAAGCGGGGDGAPEGAGRPRAEGRSGDPRVREARRALEDGRLAAAGSLVAQVGDSAGPESFLLRARLAHLQGDLVAALREVEAARRAWPGDSRAFATAAEIYAWEGHAQAAEDEIKRGLAVAGETSDLERARGVYLISRPGGALAGLEHLERAREADPELPYLRRPLAQAHLLAGRHFMSRSEPVKAAEHARASLDQDPQDPDARQLLGDACASAGDFGRALEVYAELLREGHPVATEMAFLHRRRATELLLEKRRPEALEHWLAARSLGLGPDDLGHGQDALEEEAERCVEAGYRAYQGGDLDEARRQFARALVYDPAHLEAQNHLGVVYFQRAEYASAADCWRAVVVELRRLGEPLPRPVHLNLCQALTLSGRLEEARQVLEAYLEEEPEGEFAADTRAMLAHLESVLLAEDGAEEAPMNGRDGGDG